MTQCPICKLTLNSHSTEELMECAMMQIGNESDFEEGDDNCPNCRHEINSHSDDQITECTIAYLKSVTLE